MGVKTFVTHRMVKSEDLNHHGTLFAGRGAEWFVESGFVAAASLTSPEETVCVKVHGMVFTRPVRKGAILRAESEVVLAGRTSLVTYVKMVLNATEDFVVDGFLTFIHVDKNGQPNPHGIKIDTASTEDAVLQERAKAL